LPKLGKRFVSRFYLQLSTFQNCTPPFFCFPHSAQRLICKMRLLAILFAPENVLFHNPELIFMGKKEWTLTLFAIE
jgi:hypothetical protein